jgi:predicted transcriptional regulator of viral defense system
VFARNQHGLVTRGQALAAGLTPSAIRVRVAKGSWLALRRTVYALAGVRPTPEQAALAVCLAVPRGCWASHRSAAALWGLDIPRAGGIEVTTVAQVRVDLAGVRQHRSTALAMADLTHHRLVPVTSVSRTLVDCAPYLPGHRLARAVDDADRRGLTEIETLAACVDRLDRGGRRLVVPLRAVLADRLEGRLAGGSRREVEVIDILRAAGVPLPVQQYEVVVGGRRRILDYAHPEALVGLEWDGFAEHGKIRSTFDDDRLRGNDLALAGWLMLHFTSRTPAAHIVQRTLAALAQRQRRSA